MNHTCLGYYIGGKAYAIHKSGEKTMGTDTFRVRKFDDGIYRWIYELNMYKNPIILITVFKVLGMVAVIVFMISTIIQLIAGNFSLEFNPDGLKVIVGVVLVLIAITVLSYFIVAKQYGGKYIVIFEMTEDSITHRQMDSQFDKAKALGWWTTIIGMASGNLATAGIGLTAATRNSMTSEYASVRKVKAKKWQHLIHVNGVLERNQVYVCDEDFDFVMHFLKERCINAR